jgi:LuxR family maltose regulon positive regulatory protein
MFLTSQLNTLLAWHNQLPQFLIDAHPRLCLIFAWAWVSTGKPEEAEHCLQAAEKVMGAKLCDWRNLPESNQFNAATRGALLEMAVVRAQLAIGRGDIPEALKMSNFALPYLEEVDCPYLYNSPIGSRMAAHFIRGLAQKHSGELEHAAMAFVEAGALAKKLNHVHIVALSHGYLANLQSIQGRLRQAFETCLHGLSEVEQMAGEKSPLSGFLRAEYGNLLYERNDLDAAAEHFREAIRVAKPWGFLDAFIPGLTGLAQFHAAQENWQAAFEALDELQKLGRNNPQLVKPVVESHRALLWARHGNLDLAQHWMDTAGLDPVGEIAYQHEDEFITLAQVLIVQKRLDEAARLHDRLLDVAKVGRRGGRMIKLLALRSILLQAQGKRNEAAVCFDRALALAAPEGYMRTFLDLGAPMKALLQDSLSTHPDYAGELLAVLETRTTLNDEPSVDGLIEPLSERELDVLRLLATELTGPEIAQELVVALSTLRTHTQQIYRKLGVTNRRAALKAAQELRML